MDRWPEERSPHGSLGGLSHRRGLVLELDLVVWARGLIPVRAGARRPFRFDQGISEGERPSRPYGCEPTRPEHLLCTLGDSRLDNHHDSESTLAARPTGALKAHLRVPMGCAKRVRQSQIARIRGAVHWGERPSSRWSDLMHEATA